MAACADRRAKSSRGRSVLILLRFFDPGGEERTGWLGREDSNLRMVESKSTALRLSDAPQPIGAWVAHKARDSGSNRLREIAPILLRIDWLSGSIGALL
jgi:hypothetical protein